MGSDGLPDLPGYVIDPSWKGLVSLALTLLLPVLVGLLATRSWSAAAKGALLVVLAGVKAVAEAALAGELGTAVLYSIGANVLIAVVVHLGFYRAQTSSGVSVAGWAIDHGRTVTTDVPADTVDDS